MLIEVSWTDLDRRTTSGNSTSFQSAGTRYLPFVMAKPLHILHLEDDPDYSTLVKNLLHNNRLDVELVRVERYEQFLAALIKDTSQNPAWGLPPLPNSIVTETRPTLSPRL